MTRDHDPFTQALISLRARTTHGVYAPGQPIVIVEEARRLRLSATPVREALSWLSGEGLVERAASGGYFAPRLDAAIIRDRYGFQLTCLRAALDLASPAVATRRIQRVGRAQSTFDQIIRRSGSSSLGEAYRRVAAMLEIFVVLEAALIPDHIQEAADLHHRHGDAERTGLWDALVRYHQRRADLAADLLIALRDGPASSVDEGI